jgi:hypothetical protein
MKITRIAPLPLVFVMAISSSARAQEDSLMDRPGLDVGLRLGYAAPFGKLGGVVNMSDFFSGAIPLVLELGYRINANATIGILFQYAFALTKNCDPGASCSGSVIRLGLEGLFHIPVEGPFVPWLGLGTGYEWLSLDESGSTGGSVTVEGFEFLNLQAGGDYRLSPYFSLGPFVSFSLARYDSGSTSSGAGGEIRGKAIHEWLQFGMKGTFNL